MSRGQLGLLPPTLGQQGPLAPGVPGPGAGAAKRWVRAVLILPWRGQRPASQASTALDLSPAPREAVSEPGPNALKDPPPTGLGAVPYPGPAHESPPSDASGPWPLEVGLWPPQASGLQSWFLNLRFHRKSVISVCGLPCWLAQGALEGSGSGCQAAELGAPWHAPLPTHLPATVRTQSQGEGRAWPHATVCPRPGPRSHSGTRPAGVSAATQPLWEHRGQ